MRPVIAENRDRWVKTLEDGARRVLGGKMDASQMFGQVGMMVAGEIAQGIASVTAPALSESTIASRKSARKSPGVSRKPLVDTGLMIQSVSSKVENV